jgi:hypothetical protein
MISWWPWSELQRLRKRVGELVAELHALRAHTAGVENQNQWLMNALRARDARDFGEGPIAEQLRQPRVH